MSGKQDAADIEFVVTPRIQAACKKCITGLSKTSKLRKDLEHLVLSPTEPSSTTESEPPAVVKLSTIKAVSAHLVKHKDNEDVVAEDVWVFQILRGSRIHIAEPERPKRNPELVARLDAIKKQLEEQEYMRMTSGVGAQRMGGGMWSREDKRVQMESLFPAVPGVRTGRDSGIGSVRQEMAAVNRQISVIINILFSGLGVGFAIWYVSYTLTSEMGWRILMGLAAAIFVILAETWLFVFAGTRGHKKRLPPGLQKTKNQ